MGRVRAGLSDIAQPQVMSLECGSSGTAREVLQVDASKCESEEQAADFVSRIAIEVCKAEQPELMDLRKMRDDIMRRAGSSPSPVVPDTVDIE